MFEHSLLQQLLSERRFAAHEGSLVDVHAHFLPDAYRSAAVAAGHG
jgi:hypothetical protein